MNEYLYPLRLSATVMARTTVLYEDNIKNIAFSYNTSAHDQSWK